MRTQRKRARWWRRGAIASAIALALVGAVPEASANPFAVFGFAARAARGARTAATLRRASPGGFDKALRGAASKMRGAPRRLLGRRGGRAHLDSVKRRAWQLENSGKATTFVKGPRRLIVGERMTRVSAASGRLGGRIYHGVPKLGRQRIDARARLVTRQTYREARLAGHGRIASARLGRARATLGRNQAYQKHNLRFLDRNLGRMKVIDIGPARPRTGGLGRRWSRSGAAKPSFGNPVGRGFYRSERHLMKVRGFAQRFRTAWP